MGKSVFYCLVESGKFFFVIVFFEESFKKKGKKIWEGVELTVKSDVFIGELNAVFNIGILFFFYESIQRCCCRIVCFYFYGNERICVTNHKINF